MRTSARYAFLVLAVLCASCDLHPRIMSVWDRTPENNNGKAKDNAAGCASGQCIDKMYGQDFDSGLYGASDVEYAKISDYNAPKEIKSESNRDNATTPAPVAQLPKESVVVVDSGEDVLLVPNRVAASARAPEIIAPARTDVVVEKGDTLYNISQRNKVPLRDLADINKLSAPYNLAVGQKLKLPDMRVHTIAAGDTLYSVSRRYSVDLNSLAEFNALKEPYSLSVGQKLRLPATITNTATITSVANAPVRAVTTVSKKTAVPVKSQDGVKSTATVAQNIVEAPKVGTSGNITKLPSAAKMTSTKFSWPVRGKIISSFGSKQNGLYNDGINIAAKLGTKVSAAENGVIGYAGNELKGMGNLVIIQHSGGWMTVYSHMDTLSVKRGKKVVVGEKIGTVGQTGKVSQPQLHFEIRKGTKAYNPTSNMKK